MTTTIIVPAGRALSRKLDGDDFRPQTMIGWRAQAAADLAIRLRKAEGQDPLVIVAGDGASKVGLMPGTFNERVFEYLRSRGIENVLIADNGGNEHTRGDMHASVAHLIKQQSVGRVYVVTCWYHIPRALAVLHDELRLAGITSTNRPAIRGIPVWRDIWYGLERWRDLRRGELRGVLDALRGRGQCTRRNWHPSEEEVAPRAR